MEKIEKWRKLCKIVNWAGIGVVVVAALGMMVLQQFSGTQVDSNQYMITLVVIMSLFVAVSFVTIPLQTKLLKLVILESLDGLVTDVEFSRKKGYSKESFLKLCVAPDSFTQYGCSDYYSFNYRNINVESVTAKAYDEIKYPKSVGPDGKKIKAHKVQKTYFHGRIYIIPLKTDCRFNVYGKSNSSLSRKKEITAATSFKNEYALKVKKQAENFEVFYEEDKPAIDVQKFMDRLLTLKLQAKGPVHCFVRQNSLVLLIDNGRYYQEIDVKKPVEDNLIRGYRRDVSMVLSFINTISNSNNELNDDIKG